MKRHIAIWFGIALTFVVGAWAVSRFSPRHGLSMSLLEYTRWPHGAVVRLTNNTRKTIRYLAERDDTPKGGPILRANKTHDGWVDQSATVGTSLALNPGITNGLKEVFVLNPPTQPKNGDRIELAYTRDLRPGQSVDFFVRLEPGASPQRIGTVCIFPQNPFGKMLRPWLNRITQWCRLKITVPGRVEVWCPESLSCPPTGEAGQAN